MKPIDYRNDTWESLQDRLEAIRLDVYRFWMTGFIGTTRQGAEKSGIDLLTFRPRTTELFQLGLVEVVEGEPGPSSEGVYRGVPLTVARARFEAEVARSREPQLSLL